MTFHLPKILNLATSAPQINKWVVPPALKPPGVKPVDERPKASSAAAMYRLKRMVPPGKTRACGAKPPQSHSNQLINLGSSQVATCCLPSALRFFGFLMHKTTLETMP